MRQRAKRKMEFKIGEKVSCKPYRDNKYIEVIGYIVDISRSIICKKAFIKIKGIKKNTLGDFIRVTIKVFDYDFDLIKKLKQ